MRKFASGILNRNKSVSRTRSIDYTNAPPGSPEATAVEGVRTFCETGSASDGSGDEVLHLPVIVDAAESSPNAAAAAAQQIRTFLGKDWSKKPQVQYNAIMLIRILSDNPGPTFTRNFDKSFVSAVKDCLQNNRDHNTQQILRETLDSIEVNKHHDETVQLLLQMWRKFKGSRAVLSQDSRAPDPRYVNAHGLGGRSGGAGGGASRRRPDVEPLPSPEELASRVEESKNTAKILLQFIQSTSQNELLGNDLIVEFGDRCQLAQRNMQSYINSTNPAPDHNTMQTLIETNEQLSLAVTRYQRAVLSARRALGVETNQPLPQSEAFMTSGAFASAPTQGHDTNDSSAFSPPSSVTTTSQPTPNPPSQAVSGFQQRSDAPQLPPLASQGGDDPFADPLPAQPPPGAPSSFAPATNTFSINSEPTYPTTPEKRNMTGAGHAEDSAVLAQQGNVSPVNTMGAMRGALAPSPTDDYDVSPQARRGGPVSWNNTTTSAPVGN